MYILHLSYRDSDIGSYLAARNLYEVQVPGDGHCIAHAVSQALSASVTCKAPVCSKDIVNMVLAEASENIDFYKQWSDEEVSIQEELEKWAEEKSYGTDTTDLILHMIANAAQVQIVKVERDSQGVQETVIKPGNTSTVSSTVIHLVKRTDHYNCGLEFAEVRKVDESDDNNNYCENLDEEITVISDEDSEEHWETGDPVIKAEHTGFPYISTKRRQSHTKTNSTSKRGKLRYAWI